MDDLHIDITDVGVISGWITPESDGSPALVEIRWDDIEGCPPEFFSSRPRPDVQKAGGALLCGFEILIFCSRPIPSLRAVLPGGRAIPIAPTISETELVLHVDSETGQGPVRGWIEGQEPPHSLVVSDGSAVQHASFHDRADIAEFRGARFKRSGVVLDGITPGDIKWMILNNSFLRIF